MRTRSLPTLVALGTLVALASVAIGAPPKKPARLLEDWIKARGEEKRAAAWKAIEDAPALQSDEVRKLAAEVLRMLAKAGRRVPPRGRHEWFSDREQAALRKRHGVEGKRDFEGIFYASGGSRRGLALGLHGGGRGSGDASSAKGAFSGAIGSLKLAGLYPQVLEKTEYGWTQPEATERWVMELLKRARVSWGVDPNRVYVTGHSMGGYGTWTYLSIYADLFAGGAVFAGGPTVFWVRGMVDVKAEATNPGYTPNLRNVPIFVYQSLDDPRVRPAANQQAIRELKALHEKDPDGWEYVYEEVDKQGHGFPKKGPAPGLKWVTSHVRDPRPKKIVWQPTRTWKRTFYWLRWEDPWLSSIVTATRDVEKNRIDIEIERPRAADAVKKEKQREAMVRGLSVYLDDRVLDLSKEIVITVDGKVRYRGIPTLSLAILARSAQEREDPEYVFAAEAKMGPVPAGEKNGE